MRPLFVPFLPIAGASVLLLLAVGGDRVAAQNDSTRAWLRIDSVRVKPELWSEYRDLERDEVIPALRKGGVGYRAAWRTAEFGETYELVFVRPIADFGEYAAGDSFSKAMPPREAERLRERLRRCLLGRETTALVQRSDLSVGETGRPFVVITTHTVMTGRGGDYETFLRETLPDFKKSGIVFGVYQRVYGAQTAWLLVENLESLSELARPTAFFRAFGQEGGADVASRLIGIVSSVERRVLRFDPELSFSVPGRKQPQ